MILRGRLIVVLVSIVLSWTAAAALPSIFRRFGWHPETMPPDVPFVVLPVGSHTDVRSSVYYLIVIIAVGLASSLLLEIAKFVTRATSLYLVLLFQQVIVIADTIRSHAWDWWIFLLSLTRIAPIHELSWLDQHSSLAGRWPWPSALTAVALGVVAIRSMKHDLSQRTS